MDPIERVVEVLNEAARADPVAMYAVHSASWPCNEALASHPPFSPLCRREAEVPSFGVLGLLNAIFGDERRRVACRYYKGTGRVEDFLIVDRDGHPELFAPDRPAEDTRSTSDPEPSP